MEKAGATEALDVIYEDEVLLVADKPAGILVHGDGTGVRTLTDLVADHLAATGRPDARAQAVQRLDVGTSGLVLFSLDKDTQPALDAQVAGHAMAKRYLAVVQGRFPSGDKVIEQPLGRDRHDARRMRVCAPAGESPPSRACIAWPTRVGAASWPWSSAADASTRFASTFPAWAFPLWETLSTTGRETPRASCSTPSRRSSSTR